MRTRFVVFPKRCEGSGLARLLSFRERYVVRNANALLASAWVCILSGVEMIYGIGSGYSVWVSLMNMAVALMRTWPLWQGMSAAQEERLVVVELFSGISATTEALLRAGVKIKKLYCCNIDPKAQAVTKARASDWLQVFPELLKPSELEGFHSFFPQNVELIGNSHVLAMEKPDLIVAGFPCQGFSRVSGQA
jgi:hypothetical protein